MPGKFIIGVPSKGRLMEDTLALFRAGGLRYRENRRRARLPGRDCGRERSGGGIPLRGRDRAAFAVRAAFILGVTGEDLIREQIPDADERVELLLKLGFGHADVVTAVPDCWLDVETMADLEEAGALFAARAWQAASRGNEISDAHAPVLSVEGGGELSDG